MWYLVGDIGGTNTRLWAVEWLADQQTRQYQSDYDSQTAGGLLSLVQRFISEHAIPKINSACFAVAGPVREGVARITNLPWVIRADELAQALQIERVTLINDFSGVAYGISELVQNDVQTLQSASPQANGTVLVLGAGTGLGMAIVDRSGDTEQVIETEAGHVGFSPNNEEEVALMAYWHERLGRVSNETFLSGPGIVRIFDYYCSQAKQPASETLLENMKVQEPAKVINTFAQKYKEPLAVKTMQRFASIYASVAGDMALATKASGGVYLAGGIAPSALAFLQTDQFLQVFNNKPPMQALLATIPVQVITNTSVGLLGALAIAKR